MNVLPFGRSPHRHKHPRKCDRCARRAEWNWRPRSGMVRYYCGLHVPPDGP